MKWFAKVRLGSWASDATATAERVMPWLDSLAQVSPLLADWKLLGKSRYECLVARPLTLDTLRVRLWEGRSKVTHHPRIPGFPRLRRGHRRGSGHPSNRCGHLHRDRSSGNQHAGYQIRRT